MSDWPSCRASRVLATLQRIGWTIKRQSGSHRTLERPGWDDYTFAFHDREEIGATAAGADGFGTTDDTLSCHPQASAVAGGD